MESQHLPIPLLVWARWTVQAVAVALWLVPQAGLRTLVRTRKLTAQLFRGAVLIGSSLCFVSALKVMPLAEVTALNYTTPVLVTILAVVFLDERMTRMRVAFVVAGFAGMLLVVRPGGELFQGVALFALGSAWFYAMFQITTRKLADEDWRALLFYPALVGAAAMTVLLPFLDWRSPVTLQDGAMIVAAGLLGSLGHFLFQRAFQRAAASAITPFTYVQLVWSTLAGWIAFACLRGPSSGSFRLRQRNGARNRVTDGGNGMQADFWHERWQQGQLGFHQDDINLYLQQYWGRLGATVADTVFVQLCGKSADMLWLRAQGHAVLGVELSQLAVQAFFAEHGLQPMLQRQRRNCDVGGSCLDLLGEVGRVVPAGPRRNGDAGQPSVGAADRALRRAHTCSGPVTPAAAHLPVISRSVARPRNGRPMALEGELARLRQPLLRFAQLQLRDPALAEDAVSETMLAILERPGQFAGRSSLRTYATGILHSFFGKEPKIPGPKATSSSTVVHSI